MHISRKFEQNSGRYSIHSQADRRFVARCIRVRVAHALSRAMSDVKLTVSWRICGLLIPSDERRAGASDSEPRANEEPRTAHRQAQHTCFGFPPRLARPCAQPRIAGNDWRAQTWDARGRVRSCLPATMTMFVSICEREMCDGTAFKHSQILPGSVSLYATFDL